MIWEIQFDPATWLEVPDLTDNDAEEWIDRASDALVKDFATEHGLEADYPLMLRQQLAILTQLAHSKASSYGHLLAHLPGPEWDPFAVFVAFREPREESPDYLVELAGAGGPAAQPPTVEHVTVDDLGEGIRVLRYEDDPNLGLIANLCYAWRAHGTDVIMFTQTDDLARLELVMPDLTALAASIHPGSADGD